ncbi:MAG: Nramp family divalent metal transporter [Flavobacteriales bacterium]|nr:Nramp family divalent metal transporter [Flavobacteriales bacterium]
MTSRFRKFWRKLGPGLITGASDDDPSGIATYSQAGARFGPKLLWTALATYPLMVAMQEMSARIGLVTGTGLMGNIRRHYPRWVTALILLLSFPAITLNIGADIASMGAVVHMMAPGIPSFLASVAISVLLVTALIVWNYRQIATVLKWLCIALFSYILIPFLTTTDWREAVVRSVWPDVEASPAYFMALVGILGTTISPYLFFWQASMEVEEVHQRHLVVDKRIIAAMGTDVRLGMLLTNVVFFFIILATGTVLFHAGAHDISTVEQAAEALRPLAGDMAYALFACGILGTGLLAIPVLAGSLSYMLAETFGWEEGLDRKFHEAKGFYLTMVVSIGLGLSLEQFGIGPIQALLWTAVLYGLTAPVLIAVMLHLCNRPGIMGDQVNRRWSNILGGLTLLLMTGAAITLAVLWGN